MTAVLAELLAEARSHGIVFALRPDGILNLKARQAPPADLVERIRAAKPAVVAALAAEATEAPQEWREGVDRLRRMLFPDAVPVARWRALVSDAARFLAAEWPRRAAGMGWRTVDLFGCHPRRPLVRYDCRGALWGVDGAEIVAITESAVMIRSSTSSPPLACRKPNPAPGEPVILAWQLEPAMAEHHDMGPDDAA